jgi:hypothetical protein
MRTGRRFAFRRAAAAATLSALALAPGPARSAPGELSGRASESARAERARAASLAAELAAARSHRLYLVLDPAGPALELRADGLMLRRFPVESARFGRSRLAGGELSWPAYAFSLTSELQEPERPRIPIQAPEANPQNARAPLPATAAPAFGAAQEEALGKVPAYYRLRFEPPLDVSVLGEAGVAGLPGRLWRARHRLVEGWEALAAALRGREVPPRVVLVMTPGEARRLFTALLPRMQMVLAGPRSSVSGHHG